MKLNKNNKAWSLLTSEEQTALQLNLGHGKSTWKAGEIMAKSHYKFIEIRERAVTFFRIFTHHLQEYGKLIPDGVNISPDLRAYLSLTILERHRVNKAIELIDNPLFHRVASREALMVEEITKWKSSIRIEERHFYNFIMDFDRWNNFRIMPKALQEPSAFKRRDKNKLKKHLKIGSNLPLLTYKVLKENYEYKGKQKANLVYLAIITEEPRRIAVIGIQDKPKLLKPLTQSSLYLFRTDAQAAEYLELTLAFIKKETKHCVDGLRFWPKYRDLIKKAINYDEIMNIIPSRKYLLT